MHNKIGRDRGDRAPADSAADPPVAAAEGHLPELGDAREDAAENRGVPAATGAVEPVADWQRPFAVPSDDKSERADLLSPPAMPWEAREAP